MERIYDEKRTKSPLNIGKKIPKEEQSENTLHAVVRKIKYINPRRVFMYIYIKTLCGCLKKPMCFDKTD